MIGSVDQDLFELERYINDIWQFLPIPVAYLSPLGVVLDANRGFEQLTRFSKEELIGRKIGDLCPFFLSADFRELIKSGKQIKRLESITTTREEGQVPVSIYAYARKDENEAIIGCFAALIEITERKQQEARLIQSEAEYRVALNSMIDAIHVIDADYHIIMVNETLRKWNHELGLPVDIIGKDIFEVFPFLSARVRDEYRHVFETGKILFTEETTKVGDKEFVTDTRKIPIIGDGKVVRIVTEVRDITSSKMMQVALKNSEERFRVAATSVSDLIWDWDIPSGKLEWFGKVDEFLGYAPGEFPRTVKAWEEAIHPADHVRVMSLLNKHLTSREPYDIEYRVVRKDGSIRYWIDHGTAFWNDENKAYRMVGVCTDITDRKIAEQRIFVANERLKFLLSSSSAIIYTAKVSGDYGATYISDNVLQMTGYAPHNFTGQSSFWLEHVHPDDRERILSEIHYVFELASYAYEYRFQRKDGQYIWVRDEMRLVRNHIGEPLEIVGYMVDITERRIAEEAAIRGERKYRQLIELTHEGVWAIDEDSNTTFVNPQMAKMLGYEIKEMTGMPLFSFMDEQNVETAKKKVERRKLGIVEQHDFEFLSKSGKKVYVLMETAPIIADDGKYAGAVATVNDITERVQGEQALRYHLEFEKIVTTISTHFISISPAEIDRAIDNALMTIGQFAGAGRSYVFMFSPDGSNMSNTHEWCAEHVESQMHRLKDIPVETFSWLTERLRRLETINIPKVAELPKEARSERDEFDFESIKSIVVVPMVFGGKLIGCVGFDAVIEERLWSEQTITILRVVGEIFANALEHKLVFGALAGSLGMMKKILDGTVVALASAAEKKDPYTAGHQRRVTQLAIAIARELGFSEDQIEGIKVGGTLHDIGKIYVPTEILSKPTKLTEVEYSIVKIHPQVGHDILSHIEFPWPVIQMVIQHHERLDGSGYPNRLKESAIIPEARILTVADVVEAMSSHRPYRPAKGSEAALEEITKNKGILYDAQIVDTCLKLFKEKNFRFE